MQTKKLPLSKLTLNDGSIKGLPKNPRFIRDIQYEKLLKSIDDDPEMLSLRELIVVPRDGKYIVIAGNMRLRALRERKFKDAPCKVLSGNTPVKKLRAYAIKDNLAFGEWDADILANEFDIKELESFGVDLTKLGIRVNEAEEDDYELPDTVKTNLKPGDLITIGRHRLLCGDAREKAQVDKLMAGERADIVFTDPPYGVSIGAKNRFLNKFQKSGRNLKDITSDSLKPDELHDQLLPAFENIRESMKDCSTAFVCAPQGGDLGMMLTIMKDAKLPTRHILIWKKNSPTFSLGRLDYEYQHEPILLTWKKTHKYYGLGEHRTSVWEIDKPRKSEKHPTMKPIALVANALLNNSKEGDLVIDFYLGSGTTLLAAEQLNRTCYAMELDPPWCQVIIDRLLEYNAELPVSINGKKYKPIKKNNGTEKEKASK
jgi:DNA modification methylase